MKRTDIENKLATGNFYLWQEPWNGGTWKLVDNRNNIPCAGRIMPSTAKALLGKQK